MQLKSNLSTNHQSLTVSNPVCIQGVPLSNLIPESDYFEGDLLWCSSLLRK